MLLDLLHWTSLHLVQIFFEKYNVCNEIIKIVGASYYKCNNSPNAMISDIFPQNPHSNETNH